MGKKKDKKKKKKNDTISNITIDMEGLTVKNDTFSFFEKLDNEDDIDVPTVAREIRRRIKNGASADDISWYKSKALKATLSFFRIDGRAKLTYKEDMAKALIEAFGGITDEHGKKSKKKNEEVKLAHNDELSKLIIRNIKKGGGLN